MGKKEFLGTCVGNPFGRIETLVEIIDNAKEITKETFLKHCSVHSDILKEFRTYPNDYGFYKNSNVYFYTWSAIEHFYR